MKKRISKKLRGTLLLKCNQEDIQTLYLNKSNKDKFIISFVKERIIKIRNWLWIEIGNRFEVPFISILLTQKCTLKCVNCSDLMPFYKNPENFPANKVLLNLKRYLSVVDGAHFVLLCGGETFLYPELEKILEFCINEKKIRNIGIVTNGTLIPDEKVCNLLSNHKVRVRVSNYRCVREKRKRTITYLRNCGVLVEDLGKQKWYDVGGFEDRQRNVRQMEQLFSECVMNNCFEINKNKVIYCARQRSGELGLTPPIPSQDYVSLKLRNRKRLKEELMQMYEKRFLVTCNYCDGITKDSKRVIPGKQ